MAQDADADLLGKAIGIKDFFGSVLLRDDVTDWNLAKEVGEFLIRIEPGSNVELVGRVLLVRACRHLADKNRALDELKQCWQEIPHRRLAPVELEMFVPLLSKEEKLLLGRDVGN